MNILGSRFPRFTPSEDTTTPRTPTSPGLSGPLTRCTVPASTRLQATQTIAADDAGVLPSLSGNFVAHHSDSNGKLCDESQKTL